MLLCRVFYHWASLPDGVGRDGAVFLTNHKSGLYRSSQLGALCFSNQNLPVSWLKIRRSFPAPLTPPRKLRDTKLELPSKVQNSISPEECSFSGLLKPVIHPS